MGTVRFFYAINDVQPVELYVDGILKHNSIGVNFSHTFAVQGGVFPIELRSRGNVIFERRIRLDHPNSLLVVAYAKDGSRRIAPFILPDRTECPKSGAAKYRFINAVSMSHDNIVVNEAILGDGPSTPYQEVITLENHGASSYVDVNPNKIYSFRLQDRSGNVIYVNENPIRFKSGYIYDFIITKDQELDIAVLSTDMCYTE